MTPTLQAKVKEYKDTYLDKAQYVVELGSFNVNGGVRHFFEDDKIDYCGVDMVRGPGVDIVSDIHECNKLFDYQPDVVICLETLEHDNKPWESIKAMRELLQPHGYLIISTPMNGFPDHKYPKDYFRYMTDAYTDLFFEGYEILDLCEIYYEGYGTICGIARKPLK